MQRALVGRGNGQLFRIPIRLASGLQAQGWWIPDHKPRRFPETAGERRAAAAKYGLRGWWIPDRKPRRFPETAGERRAAAAKYGLREEDYEPYPMGYDCIGEYPDLGKVAHIHKDPYENWSHETWRRNYGEPVPWEFKLRTPDRRNFSGLEHHEVGVNAWFPSVAGSVLFFTVLYLLYLGYPIAFRRIIYPYMPKQMPYDFKRSYPFEDPTAFPILNYTFEPATFKE